MINVTCPFCANHFPLQAGLNEADSRRFAEMMGELPPQVARQMPAYLMLHKPKKQGLRMSKIVSLMQDLAPEIKAAQVTRDGITHAAPAAVWVAALEKVIEMPNLQLPLAGNGLLREICVRLASREEGKQERKTEEVKRYRPATTVASAPKAAGDVVAKAAGYKSGAAAIRGLLSGKKEQESDE